MTSSGHWDVEVTIFNDVNKKADDWCIVHATHSVLIHLWVTYITLMKNFLGSTSDMLCTQVLHSKNKQSLKCYTAVWVWNKDIILVSFNKNSVIQKQATFSSMINLHV